MYLAECQRKHNNSPPGPKPAPKCLEHTETLRKPPTQVAAERVQSFELDQGCSVLMDRECTEQPTTLARLVGESARLHDIAAIEIQSAHRNEAIATRLYNPHFIEPCMDQSDLPSFSIVSHQERGTVIRTTQDHRM